MSDSSPLLEATIQIKDITDKPNFLKITDSENKSYSLFKTKQDGNFTKAYNQFSGAQVGPKSRVSIGYSEKDAENDYGPVTYRNIMWITTAKPEPVPAPPPPVPGSTPRTVGSDMDAVGRSIPPADSFPELAAVVSALTVGLLQFGAGHALKDVGTPPVDPIPMLETIYKWILSKQPPPVSRPAHTAQSPRKWDPQVDGPPPVDDRDIPFVWLVPLVPAVLAASMASVLC